MANTSTNTKGKHKNATADSATESERQVFETFKALRLKKDLLKGIGDYGYVKPCAVHLQTIVPLCGKTDVFAKVAEFEPGRISAICIGILQKLDCASPKCQAVVFAASKLSSQVIGKAMEQLGAYLKVKVYVCDGSEGDCPDDVHVVVGKAMYVMDEWSPSWEEHIKVVFFDKPSWQSSLEIAYIFTELLPSREKYHVCCFLERESMEVKTFKRVWMKEPVIIRVPHTLVLDKGKRRHLVISVTDDESKLCEIIHIYERSTKKMSVVFADSPKSVEILIKEMNKHKLVEVLPTTVGMKQKDRDRMTQKLLQAEARRSVLITTIEWANDIDLKQVELVVNYDLPHPVLEDYLHRMCRFGVEVDVINLVTGDEWFILFDIQQQYKNEVIFEAFYPNLRGPAGFPVRPVEGLEISEDKKLLPGIKHILYNVSTDKSKLSNIYEYLKEDLVKMKIVIFAKVDHSAVLKREGFNVHKMDDLMSFFQCKEDYCILLITEDKDALSNAHPKLPVVINFDLPSAPEIYNHRVAWCKTNGITMHFVTENDWLKVFHFQRPQSESIIGWPPSLVTDFSSMIRRARRGSSYSYDWESLSEFESDTSSQGTFSPSSPWRGCAANFPQPVTEEDERAAQYLVETVYYFNIHLLHPYLGDIDYRTSDREQDILNHVFRWDVTPYAEVFENGLSARRQDDTSDETFYSLEHYVHYGGRPTDSRRVSTSAFVSTSRSSRWHPTVDPGHSIEIYRYEIYAPGGIDVAETLGDYYRYPAQDEVCFVAGVARQYIRSAQLFRLFTPAGTRLTQRERVDNELVINAHINPQSHPYRALPIRYPVDYCMEDGARVNLHITYYPGAERRRQKRFTSSVLDWYTVGAAETESYINAAFRSCYSNEAYLFMNDEYVLLDYAPGTTDDKVLNGPLFICNGYPSLTDTSFAEYGIDCAFGSSTGINEAFIFFGNLCALINFAPGTTDDKIVKGPTAIATMFPFFKGTVFENGVDAAFESTTEYEAYLFKDDKSARINYEDSGSITVRSITGRFPCLKDTIFENGVDASFASHRSEEAYLFKGDSYALINFAPGTLDAYIIDGVKKIRRNWPSLRDILPRENHGLDYHDSTKPLPDRDQDDL